MGSYQISKSNCSESDEAKINGRSQIPVFPLRKENGSNENERNYKQHTGHDWYFHLKKELLKVIKELKNFRIAQKL